jgi:hypothetical protein
VREPTKLFLCERVKATADRIATADRERTKIGRVHVLTPAKCAKRISMQRRVGGVAALDAVVDDKLSNERNHTLGLSLARPLSQNGLNSKAMQDLAAN